LLDPGNKLAGVTTVGPDQGDRGHRHARAVEDAAPTVAVLHAAPCRQCRDPPHIDDAVYDELREHFTEDQLVELGVHCAIALGVGRLSATLGCK
jgi:alkylhydroperoxidase family enzyme